jgi:hypothetical protein
MSRLTHFIRQHYPALLAPKIPPIWAPIDPQQGSWAELLSASPIIIHTLPSGSHPLGAASVVGPMLRDRPIHFLVMACWTIEPPPSNAKLARIATAYLASHLLHKLIFLGNTQRETDAMLGHGFAALTINQNCLVNDSIFRPIPGVEPIYDAVYNARLNPAKRNDLAREIEKLALIFYHNPLEVPLSSLIAEKARLAAMMPTTHFINELTDDGCQFLSPQEVNGILAQSRVGLCLSAVEGAMLASMEYLLAGLSVVSTPSLGGRDYFFDDEFCIIANPDPRSIREAVDALVARNVPRHYVREKIVARIGSERSRYIGFVQELIDRNGGKTNFADRFLEFTRGRTIVNYRSMQEFAEIVGREVLGASRPH